MPGLFGYFGNDNLDILAPEMLSVLKHNENWFDGTFFYHKYGYHGLTDFKHSLHLNSYKSNGKSINIYGNLYYFKNQKLEVNIGKTILSFYNKSGLDFLKYLNGSYILSIYDNGTLIVANDRIGSKNLFYCIKSKSLTYSSEIKAIFTNEEIKPKLNYDAVYELFTFSFPLSTKTYFEDIELLPPGSVLVINQNQFVIEKYYDITFQREKLKEYSLKELLNQFNILMEKTIGKQMEDKEKIGIFLSGGLDSRLIAGFAKRIADKSGKTIITFTLGSKGGIQEKIVSQIVKKLELENIFYEIPTDSIAEFSKEIVYKGDGTIRIRDAHFYSFLRDIRKKVDNALVGLFCSELFGEVITYDILDIRTKKELINYVYKKNITLKINPKLFLKNLPLDIEERLKNNFLSTIEDIPYNNYDDIYYYWEIHQRDRRYILPLANYFNWFLDCRLPFVDKEIIDFAFNLPLKLRFGKKFIHYANKYLFPNLANIPWEKSGVPPASKGIKTMIMRKKISLSKMLMDIIEKQSHGLIKFRASDYRAYSYFIKTGSKNYINYLFKQNQKDSILNFSNINQIFKDHIKSKKDYNQLICDLVQIKLLEKYIKQIS